MRRQTGKTIEQMKVAPQNAVYVWLNGHTLYPEDVARSMGRGDLKIVSPSWLESDAWRGQKFTAIILDHATNLTFDQRAAYMEALCAVVPKDAE